MIGRLIQLTSWCGLGQVYVVVELVLQALEKSTKMSSSLACGLGRSSLGLSRLIDITGSFGSILVEVRLRGGRMLRVVGCVLGSGLVVLQS